MKEKLAKKLVVKKDQNRLLICDQCDLLTDLDTFHFESEVAESTQNFDWILVFIHNQEELSQRAVPLFSSLKKGGIIWLAYPKKSAGLHTDLSRDHGWESLKKLNYRPNGLVSLNEIWSCMRLKPGPWPSFLENPPRPPKNRVLEIPERVQKLLNEHPHLQPFFNSLSYTNKKEYVNWVTSAKKEETRQKRLVLMVDKLSHQRKNPSEK